MATSDDARKAILDKIEELAQAENSTTGILQLAEAYAWTKYANQSHGGGAKFV